MGQVIAIPCVRTAKIKRRLKELEKIGRPVYLETDVGHRFALLLVCKDDHIEFTGADGKRATCPYRLVVRVIAVATKATKKEGRVIPFERGPSTRASSTRCGNSDKIA